VSRVPFAAALTAILLAATLRAHDPVPSTISFAREIRALLADRCVSCHSSTGSSPMPLTTYDEVRPWARAIREQVLSRRMPKWHAARGYGAFINDPGLTPYEQAVLVWWLDNGMPEGTPRGASAVRPAASLTVRDENEEVLAVIVPARADVGRIASSASRWMTAWTFTPGDPLITAAVISVDGVPAATWVAGDPPTRLPPGVGLRSGARIRVDVRRRPAAAQERPFVPRRSVVTLITSDGTGLRRAWTEQVACGALRSGPPADLLAVRPLLDRAEARLSVSRPGAPASIVGWFRDFDPLYPRTYWLLRPIDMSPDARLVGEGPCRVELTLTTRASR
jgi:hypothetical protein